MHASDVPQPVSKRYSLRVLPGRLAVCKLAPHADIPDWARFGDLISITRTAAELSIVCAQPLVPKEVKAERDWRAFEVIGPLDFNLVGILAALASTLAEAGISIFALSTYDTDYLLVREVELERAASALVEAGHSLEV
jgi:hypothetical protein